MPLATSTLKRAIEQCDIDLLSRALDSGTTMTRIDGVRGLALCHALVQERPSIDVVRALIAHGSPVYEYDHDRGGHAMQLAHDRGLQEIENLLCDHEQHGGPLWHREFIRDAGPAVTVFLRQADGFGFNPDDIERPFRVGGSYGGHGYELSAENGAKEFEQITSKWEEPRWFAPWVEKIVAGVEFSLAEFVREHGEQCDRLRWVR
jgi:hypothetical protein